ncbi:MAG: cytochrome C oxidase subunit IV family protein [Porticoccaceae bacterium]
MRSSLPAVSQRSPTINRTTWVWGLLILATVVSWELGHGPGLGGHPERATVAVVLIAYLKVRLVFLDFMELRAAPRPLRLIVEAWAALVCGAIIALYWSGLARYPVGL